MALLGFEVGVAVDHEDVGHVEAHVHLLEGRSPESASVGASERAIAYLVHRPELRGGVEQAAVGEIVETQAAHEVQPFGRVPVELAEQVAGILGLRSVLELVGQKVVAHEVAAEDDVVVLAEAVGPQRAHVVLHVAVLAHVAAVRDEEVALVVLVEGVAQGDVVALPEIIFGLERAAEVAVIVLHVLRGVALAEIVAGLARKFQIVDRLVDQLLLDVVVPASVDLGIVAVILERNRIVLHILGVGQARELSGFESGGERADLLAEGAVAGVHIHGPRLRGLLRDYVHHSADGVGAVEGGGCTLDYLHSGHVVEVQAVVVDVVEGLPRQAFAVDQEEHRVASEALHIQRNLLVHGIGELQPRQLGLEQLAYMDHVCALDLLGGDDPGDYGHVLEQFRRAGRGDHHGLEQLLGFGEGEVLDIAALGFLDAASLGLVAYGGGEKRQLLLPSLRQFETVASVESRDRSGVLHSLDGDSGAGHRRAAFVEHASAYPYLSLQRDGGRERQAGGNKEFSFHVHQNSTG